MSASKRVLLVLGGATAALSLLAWTAARGRANVRDENRSPDGTAPSIESSWPASAAGLAIQPPRFPADFGVRRVFLDPGHGAQGNTGNLSSFCIDEEDTTLSLALHVADRLEAFRHFAVRVSRDQGERVEYRDRLADAAAWGADALLSFHSDVRGREDRWSPEAGRLCPISLEAPGFSVLLSDEGDASLVAGRRRLANAVALRMEAAGLFAYGGEEYQSLYEADGAQRGVFRDRHAHDKRIFVLRSAAMPSVLVETHNAWDAREAARWSEERTIDAFSAAIASALVDALD